MTEDILFEKHDDGVAVITFNRPDSLNALSPEMGDAMSAMLDECESETGVRCVAVTGTGRAFSAGGDVKLMAANQDAASGGAASSPDAAARNLAEWGWKTSGRLYSMSKPTVALVNGFAMGAAMSMALACDIRFCSAQAKFGTAFRNVALSGDFGGSWFLPRVVGASVARELYFTGEIVNADRALELGIANHVVPHEGFLDAGLEFCAQIASGPPLAIGRMKMNLVRAESMPLRDAFFAEAMHHTLSSHDEDHANAAKAFVNKEQPVFRGQ
jgi:2-(1,2-epoxy-1,2-dihydrophenyl)acetyl-CoA isomerase